MPRFEEHHRIGAAIWGLLDVLFCEVDGDYAGMREQHPPCPCPNCGAAKDALTALGDLKKLREERDEARAQVHHLTYNPHRCNSYPSCKCPAFEACLPMDAEQDD